MQALLCVKAVVVLQNIASLVDRGAEGLHVNLQCFLCVPSLGSFSHPLFSGAVGKRVCVGGGGAPQYFPQSAFRA